MVSTSRIACSEPLSPLSINKSTCFPPLSHAASKNTFNDISLLGSSLLLTNSTTLSLLTHLTPQWLTVGGLRVIEEMTRKPFSFCERCRKVYRRLQGGYRTRPDWRCGTGRYCSRYALLSVKGFECFREIAKLRRLEVQKLTLYSYTTCKGGKITHRYNATFKGFAAEIPDNALSTCLFLSTFSLSSRLTFPPLLRSCLYNQRRRRLHRTRWWGLYLREGAVGEKVGRLKSDFW